MTTVENLKKYLKEIEANDKKGKKINAFLQLRDEKELLKEAKDIDAKKKKGRLAGKIIAVKSNINVKGLNASCASKTLENYKSPYDATVVRRIRQEDGLIIGMLNCDEFACGWSGETSAFGPTRNPIKPELVAGGSSSGSAAAVAAKFCDITLGSDTGGSIRNPASHCGIVGVKPTYGSVSRYGLIDMAMSFDQIGPLAKSVYDAALVLDAIHGRDEKDSISKESKKLDLKSIQSPKKRKRVLGVLDFEIGNREIQKLIDSCVEEVASKEGWNIKKVKLNHIDLALATYFPIVYVEFFSATRRFDGRRYGKRIEDVAGPEVLRRVLGGGEISKAEYEGRYYHKALEVRKIIKNEFRNVFKEVDCIISPVVPRLPHKIGEKISTEEMFQYDALTCPMNLAGNCAMSLPVGKIQGIPVGMQIVCDKFEEQKMFEIAKMFETNIELSHQKTKIFK